ncbi:MAG: quinoprotein dehydrogenase-associated SoxYZ-like carrier, partial [Herminiimonas sp.]|nr:quinoprotein dehydrogenase-associated SoxYZ-like carrier [Herminiimonas sp.]
MKRHYRSAWLGFALGLLLPLTVLAADPPPPPQNNPVWQKLRTGLFQERPISDNGNELIELVAPERAEDAAVVPVSIKTRVVQTPER